DKGARTPDAGERTRLQQQGRTWLQASLNSWDNLVRADAPDGRALVWERLEAWQSDPNLASVRGDENLKNLPEASERVAWKELWSNVDALLQRARPAGR